MTSRPIGVRWTIGDVSDEGFAALRLSILGAYRLFGPEARYAVCVNTVPVDRARALTGQLPQEVEWQPAGQLPEALAAFLDEGMAEGVAWKLAPLRLFPDRFELALDNDCILWRIPDTMRQWLEAEEPRCLISADVRPAHGAFAHLTRPDPRNTGIRGFPPGYDLEAVLCEVLARHHVRLVSELDEQGLQVAAMDRPREAVVVPTSEVTICSPFWPHQPWLGASGAHFVGLNSRDLPFEYYGRPATACVRENWNAQLPEITARLHPAL